MISRIWLINIVLAGCAVFIGISAYEAWRRGPEPMNVTATGVVEGAPVAVRNPLGTEPMPSEAAYRNVVEKNLFSPDREEFVPEVAPEPETPQPAVREARISGQKIVLYGVIIKDMFKKALINNPVQKADDRPYLWVSEGEALENLRVASISGESVVFDDGGERYEVMLHDKKQRQGGAPTASSGGDAPQVVTTEAKKVEAAAKPTQPKPTEAEDEGVEYEIVSTPFGEIKRRKQ